MKKSIIISVLALCASYAIAQDDTNREVKLERDYSPVISNAGKIQTTLDPIEIDVKQQPVEYWTTGYNSIYPEIGLTPLAVSDPQFAQQAPSRGYARVGFGFWYNTMLDFGYKFSNSKKTTFDVNIHHIGSFAQKQQKQYSYSTLNLALEKQTKALTVFGNARLDFDHWKYYSLFEDANNKINDNGDFKYDWDKSIDSPDWNRMWNFAFNIGLRNNPMSDTKYNVEIGYKLSNVEDKWVLHVPITENSFHVNGSAEWQLNTGSIGFNTKLKHHFYSKYTPNADKLANTQANKLVQDGVPLGWAGVETADMDHTGKSYFDLKVEPFYAFSGDNAWVHAGVNLDFSFGCIHDVGISPQVELEWQAMPSMLALYGIFTGRLGGHELESSLRANHYADPITVSYTKSNTYTPINATIGLKIHPTNGLILNLYGNYVHTLGELFAVYGYVIDKHYGTFQPDGYDLQMFRMGLNARYEYKDKLRLEADVHYNFLKPKEVKRWTGIDEQYAWYKPAFEGRLALAWHITPKWTVQLDTYFATPAHALIAEYKPDPLVDPIEGGTVPMIAEYHTAKIDPRYDINLGVTYSLNKHVSLFLNATNLAFNKRMVLYGYEQQLTSFLAGASFQF